MKVKYSVENGNTTCIIESTISTPLEEVNLKVRSTAYLHKGDIYNKEDGERIAFLKANRRLQWKLYKIYKLQFNLIYSVEKQIRRENRKCWNKFCNLDDYLETGRAFASKKHK